MAELGGLLVFTVTLLLIWAWVVVWIARALRKPEGRRMTAEWLGWVREGQDWELRLIGNAEDGVRAAMEGLCRGKDCSGVVLRGTEGEPDGPTTITDAEIRGTLR